MSSISYSGVQITLNGEAYRLPEGGTVADLLAALGADPRKVAVECNLAIVPRSAYAATPLRDEDVVELVGFIGGG